MQQLDRRKSMRVAQDFLTRCFAPGESIALLLRRENPASVTQRIVLLEHAIAPRYLGWLAHKNSSGSNIYVAVNPLRTGSRKRTKPSGVRLDPNTRDIETGSVTVGKLRRHGYSMQLDATRLVARFKRTARFDSGSLVKRRHS